MGNQKIINKLNELKVSLNELKNQHNSKEDNNLKSYQDLLKRIIDRIYPEKDAKELKDRLTTRLFWSEQQISYLDDINRAMRVINTILEESELFGFDDFKPIKEKTETEVQIGSNKIGFWRRKKTK